MCYGPYQPSVTTTQSGAWGVSGRGTGHDGTYWTMWRRMVAEGHMTRTQRTQSTQRTYVLNVLNVHNV